MFEKDMRISYLLDFYGELLDEHILGAMRSYYNDDLSLSEIAEEVGITRQGVRDAIKRAESQLIDFEKHTLRHTQCDVNITTATDTSQTIKVY